MKWPPQSTTYNVVDYTISDMLTETMCAGVTNKLFESELKKKKNCRGWQRNYAEMSRREYPDGKERLSW